jgi:hypothetical protein
MHQEICVAAWETNHMVKISDIESFISTERLLIKHFECRWSDHFFQTAIFGKIAFKYKK